MGQGGESHFLLFLEKVFGSRVPFPIEGCGISATQMMALSFSFLLGLFCDTGCRLVLHFAMQVVYTKEKNRSKFPINRTENIFRSLLLDQVTNLMFLSTF